MFSFDTRVRYSECNCKREASLTAILDYLQDCCTFQSEDLHIGIDYLGEMDAFWVLTEWQVDIVRYPVLGERLNIGTIPYEIKGFFGNRNFVITDEEGKVIVKANSVWALLSKSTGRAVKAPEELSKAYSVGEKLTMEYLPRKLPVFPEGELKKKLTVPKWFLDTNHHVNNAKYILLGEEVLPEDFVTGRIWTEYKKAAVLSDILCVYETKLPEGAGVSIRDEKGAVYANMIFFSKGEEKINA